MSYKVIPSGPTVKNWALVLLLVGVLAFLVSSSFYPIKDYDEATYAQVFHESVISGNFTTFTRGGSSWIDKPPLLFWLMRPSVAVFGESEFGLRLPNIFLTVLGIALVYLFALELSKRRDIASVSALILATTSEWIYAGREIRFDVAVAVAILAAVYCFVRSWDKEKWLVGFWLAVAAGVLFKSIIGFLAMPIALVFAIVYKKWHWLKSPWFYLGGMVFLLVAIPWHYLQYKAYGSLFFTQYLGYHLLSRFNSSILGSADHGYFYYVKYLLKLTQPWATVFFGSLVYALIKLKEMLRLEQARLLLSCTCSALVVLIFFSVSTTKLFYYIEPMLPFVAISIATLGYYLIEQVRFLKASTAKPIFAVLILSAFLLTAIQLFEIGDGMRFGEYAAARDEKSIALLIADQKVSSDLYTSNTASWDTFRYYGAVKGVNLHISKLGKDIPGATFYLAIPISILEEYSLAEEIESRSTEIYRGKVLALFLVKEAEN
ncbi:MAG TPA: glycosyltransferase family 39 protein [Candidatus Paceibacterota bacterium]